jgi:hypothetical protein
MDKICCSCKYIKEFSFFYKNKLSKDGYGSYCKECERIKSLKYYHNNKTTKWNMDSILNGRKSQKYKYSPGTKEYKKTTYLLSVYGIDLDKYNELLFIQNNSCAICKKSENELNETLSVDHDHLTGSIRGLLCAHCNHGIGKFKDNIDNLKSAISYLEQSKIKQTENQEVILN